MGVAVTLAVAGDETQTGFSFTITRGLDDLAWQPVADEAVDRAVQMLGAEKPSTAKVPVILDPFAASNFLGVLAGALNADNVLKGRSLFADMVGQQVGSAAFTLVDDGRRADGPGACPFDGEGVPSGRTELFTGGVLNGFLHSTYTARRGRRWAALRRATRSVAATRQRRASARRTSTSRRASASFDALLADAAGGVLIMDVSGVHSGANPISGEFSVGATGRRIGADGTLAEPLREMTIASTLPEMLLGVRRGWQRPAVLLQSWGPRRS